MRFHLFLMLCLLIIASKSPAADFCDSLKDSLLYYDDCESLKSKYPDVKISQSIAVEKNGRFGNCFRIERRTLNTLDNGDFAKKDSDSWIYRNNVRRLEKGGCGDSPCLELNSGKVAVPLTDLKPGSVNAFSFYAKRLSPEAKLDVTWSCGGADTALLKDFSVPAEMERVKLLLTPEKDAGTITISAGGQVIIDNAQLDRGSGFFNSFAKPGERRGCDWIELPTNGKYFNPEQGAVSCWINVPWLDKDTAGEMSALMSVKNAPARISKWGDDSILAMVCIPKQGRKDKPGLFCITSVDAQNRIADLSESLDKLADGGASGPWRHIVCNWRVKDGKINLSLCMDGGKIKLSNERNFGPVKKPTQIYIGYSGGAYLNGLLDDFAIFGRPLSDDEINKIHNSNKPLSALLK